jgi:thiol-disulfide isomerase/thioredoxin
MPVVDQEGMLKKFIGHARSSYYQSVGLACKLMAVQPRSEAPDFTLLKRDSSRFTLSSTRGRYIMIDFWASWCNPCRRAIPHRKKVNEKYHDKGFDMVSVSIDALWSDWFKALDKEQIP